MLRRMFIACGVMLGLALPALAQGGMGNTTGLVLTTCGSPVVAFNAGNPGPFTVNTDGELCVASAGGGGATTVVGTQPGDAPTDLVGSGMFVWDPVGGTWQRARGGPGATGTGTLRVVQATDSPAVPLNGPITVAGCTVGTSSANCIPALTLSAPMRWLQIQNNSATATVACMWGAGPAVLNTNGSFMLQPGQGASYGPNTGGLPTTALECISSEAATPLYVEYR